MKKLVLGITFLASVSTFSAIAGDLNGQGNRAEQLLDGKAIAVGDFCEVREQGGTVEITHNAKIEGWDVGNVVKEFNLDEAEYSNGKYTTDVGTVSRGYCGDFQSARGMKISLQRVGNKVIYTTSYRCSLSLSKTTHKHVCYLNN